MKRILTSLLALSFSASLTATELSGDLGDGDIKKAAAITAWPSIHRAWTAPGVSPNDGLGLSLGLEATAVPRSDLTEMGDGAGVAPSVIPVPRFWAAWDFPHNFQVSGSVAPGMLFDGIFALGVGIQWMFFEDETIKMSGLFHYTYSDIFGDLSVHTPGLSFQTAKDLGFWQPYAGIGFISANASADRARVRADTDTGPYTLAASHVYAGARIDLGAELSFQFDLTGRKLSFALLMSQSF
ncbi:hypothetical protein GW915_03545 [bacterium]|nr:hypothetical protein [bacterium]